MLYWAAEIDISVSKLLGFETFANFLRVSVSEDLVSQKVSVSISVLTNLVTKKSLGLYFGKKVSVLVSENLVSEKSLGFRKFGFGKKVSVSVSKKFGLRKKSRSSFRKIWSRKRKNPNNMKETRPSKQCKSLI